MIMNLLGAALLALQLPIVSDRLGFENPDKISSIQQQSKVDLTSLETEKLSMAALMQETSGKNVLLLVHGYNNPYSDALASYHTYAKQIGQDYDLVIGYLWPGGDSGDEYFSAKKRVVNELDLRLLGLLTRLNVMAKHVDVYAHSMGCRLALEALELAPGKLVRNLFLTAPAVDNESLENGERYNDSTYNCERVVVFHSRNDDVLKTYYRAGEWDRALGHKGPENPELLPGNVTVVDSTDAVSYHSGYGDADFVFESIRKIIK